MSTRKNPNNFEIIISDKITLAHMFLGLKNILVNIPLNTNSSKIGVKKGIDIHNEYFMTGFILSK